MIKLESEGKGLVKMCKVTRTDKVIIGSGLGTDDDEVCICVRNA